MAEFTPNEVKVVSAACTSLCVWVRGMYMYNKLAPQVAPQEKEANVLVAAAKETSVDAQPDLEAALPTLDDALESLKCLNRNDITEIKSLAKPPVLVKLVMEAVCIMLDEKPKMVEDPNEKGKMIPDYWVTSKKLLSGANFLQSLSTYDKDNIPIHVIRKVKLCERQGPPHTPMENMDHLHN
jgi:dynein heavy chain